MSAPLIVVDEGAGADAAVARAVDGLRADGWLVADGFDARPSATRVVLRGTVATARDAAAALLAALDGCGLVVRTSADAEVVERLVDDLRRIGHVEHRSGPAASVDPAGAAGPGVSPEGVALLALLAEGLTLGAAADRLGISRRTADRRLAEARAALGARRTTEAIAHAARRGVIGDGGSRRGA